MWQSCSWIDAPVDVFDEIVDLFFTLLKKDEELGQHIVGLGRIGAVEPVLESPVGDAEIIGDRALPALAIEGETCALEKEEEFVLFHLHAYRKVIVRMASDYCDPVRLRYEGEIGGKNGLWDAIS